MQTPVRDTAPETPAAVTDLSGIKTGPIRPPASEVIRAPSPDESSAGYDLTHAATWRAGAALSLAMVALFLVALIVVVAPFSPLLTLLATPEGLVALVLIAAGVVYAALLIARGHQQSAEE
jgi:hypothetical protein